MKIAIFTETYLSYVNGVITHVETLKNGLEKLGHEVLVVCGLPKIKKHYIKDGVLCCPSMSLKKIYNYSLAKPISPTRFKYIKKFNPDIIHIHTEFGIGFSGAYAAKLLKIPFVYTMHTMYDEYMHYIFPKRLIKIAKKTAHFYAKHLAQRASVVIGPSFKIEKFLRECGVEKTIEIVPNSVELNLFDENKADPEKTERIKEKLNLKKGDVVACFCGRLGKEKSVDVLLKYFSELVKEGSKYKLLIFGDGPCRCELEELAENLNIKDNVIFLGKIKHTDLPEYYFTCDIYITASLSEVHSISTLEAMASGLYVFSIFDKLNKYQIEDGVNGSTFKDAKEMKELILEYEQLSEEEKKNLRKKTRESILKFGEVELARKVLKVYEKALVKHSQKKKKFILKLKN